MKKRFLAASLATMMVLSLAACGGGEKAVSYTPLTLPKIRLV